MNVHIEKISLSNYRSCKQTTITPDRHLTALIGANGSGKSNILSGILLLKKILGAPTVRRNEETFLSGCKLAMQFNVGGKSIKYQALIKYATNERNIDEVVTALEKWNFKEVTGNSNWLKLPLSLRYEYPHQKLRLNKLGRVERQYTLRRLSWITGVRFPSGLVGDRILATLEAIASFVTGTSYYSASRFTDPSKCPASFELESDRLSRRLPRPGDEHIQFMYDLYTAHKSNKSEFNEFISLVGSDGIGLIDTIDYDEIDVPSSVYQVATGGRVIRREVKRVLVIPNIRVGGLKLSPNQLSEGTFRTLGILFYIITDKSRLLLLEEPEVCIHHGLLASIVELIKTFSRKKQIIISTHSDFVIDALEPSNVFIVRNYIQKGTSVKHLPQSMTKNQYRLLKEYLESVGNLGEYWRHGELER